MLFDLCGYNMNSDPLARKGMMANVISSVILLLMFIIELVKIAYILKWAKETISAINRITYPHGE